MQVNNMLGILNPLSTISNTGTYGSIGNTYQTGMSFYGVLQNQQVDRMKQEIYNCFGIEVGDCSDTFGCYIPSNVLYRMNTDTALKEKVFGMLEKYSGEEFKNSIMGQQPSIKKCTLNFDEYGEMTATLETGAEKQNKTNQSAQFLYQNFLMQQAARMPYQMNLYSGYNNLYGLNGISNFSWMQNSLFSNVLSRL